MAWLCSGHIHAKASQLGAQQAARDAGRQASALPCLWTNFFLMLRFLHGAILLPIHVTSAQSVSTDPLLIACQEAQGHAQEEYYFCCMSTICKLRRLREHSIVLEVLSQATFIGALSCLLSLYTEYLLFVTS